MGNGHQQQKLPFRFDRKSKIAVCLILYDVLAMHGAYFVALWLRFDCRFNDIPQMYLQHYQQFITLYALGAVVVFWFFRLYRMMWRPYGWLPNRSHTAPSCGTAGRPTKRPPRPAHTAR